MKSNKNYLTWFTVTIIEGEVGILPVVLPVYSGKSLNFLFDIIVRRRIVFLRYLQQL